jgi:tetratricopeptide (TPR) repeat protein
MEGPTRADSPVALAVALIFAVHPVHTEVVNSVFNRSEMLVALAGLAGLIGFVRWLAPKPVNAWASLGAAYVFALFCKESAIMLPGIAAVLALAITPGKLTDRLKTCLPLLLPAILLVPYVALRSQALAPAEVAGTETLQRLESLTNHFVIPEARRFMDVLGFWYEGIKVLVWPHPLSVVPEAITEPGRIGGLALNLALVVIGLVQAARKRYGLLTGLAFFYIASLPASRILGDPVNETHFSERYYYFPSIGLAIALAFALRYLAFRLGTRWLVAASLPVMILFMPLTWARNAEWTSDLALYQSDYARDSTSSHILVWLTGAHLEKAHYAAVEEICDRHLAQHGDSLDLAMHCGVAYARQGRLREAEVAHRAATAGELAKPAAHANLARFYLGQDRWAEARSELESAIRKEPFPARRALRTGEMLVLLYPSDRARLLEARQQFETALELQPALGQAKVWLTRVNQLLKAHERSGG